MSLTGPLEQSSGLIRKGDFSGAEALAQGLLAQARFSDAEAVFRQLCAAAPGDAQAWLGLGRALDRQKKPAEATDAFQRACELAPAWGEAQRLLGACKLRDGATLEALRCFERAVAAEPANAMHHAALANAYQQLNDHRATLTHFARAVELAPQSAPLFSTYLFELSHHPELSPEHVFAEHVRYGQTFGGRDDRVHHAARPDPNRRLRIGYVSGDFYRHTAMLFLVPVLRQHDRRRFEIFAYANVYRPDAGTAEIEALVEHWRPISALSDDAAAALILGDRIDILVDLSGHTNSNRLPVFARKPAPVQVSWLGYPATTGLAGDRLQDRQLGDQAGAPSLLCRAALSHAGRRRLLQSADRYRSARSAAGARQRLHHLRQLQRAQQDEPGRRRRLGRRAAPGAGEPPAAQVHGPARR